MLGVKQSSQRCARAKAINRRLQTDGRKRKVQTKCGCEGCERKEGKYVTKLCIPSEVREPSRMFNSQKPRRHDYDTFDLSRIFLLSGVQRHLPFCHCFHLPFANLPPFAPWFWHSPIAARVRCNLKRISNIKWNWFMVAVQLLHCSIMVHGRYGDTTADRKMVVARGMELMSKGEGSSMKSLEPNQS